MRIPIRKSVAIITNFDWTMFIIGAAWSTKGDTRGFGLFFGPFMAGLNW
ncbi:MAG TPA: hypothetical protein VKR31_03950 [Rhizomicrobium sp.]|nr:hypothetical protein [Rhizomicrobium sp.]